MTIAGFIRRERVMLGRLASYRRGWGQASPERFGGTMKRLLIAVLALLFAGGAVAQAAHQNVISWVASASTNVTGYNVYRASGSCTAAFTKLTPNPITALTFTDTGMADGAVNCYLVTAVSPGGESPQSMSQTVLLTTPTVTASVVPAPPGATTATAQ